MSLHNIEETYDAVVIGAGHAGCEAALALARLGFETILFTVSVESIALMPCNPNIGGSSKGHLVRELDALGGEMGKNIDRTFIQSKMLNISKGPAVHSLRAQADKQDYTRRMRNVIESQDHLTVRQQEVAEIITETDGEHQVITGVKSVSGAVYHAKAVVLCSGVYLKARCIYGDVSQYTGPNGLMAANNLSASLLSHGVKLVRFKTGTPARIDARSIDFSKMAEQKGDERIVPFSFSTNPEDVQIDQVSCWLTYTNEETHRVIRENIDRSPLYGGVIHATGPRYCPSIEDKFVKFQDKTRHQIFVEPMGNNTEEMYLQGFSTSLPEDVQVRMVHSLPGLDKAVIQRSAYAIEYDLIEPTTLKRSLESKIVAGLFTAGQINGSSGYEEAAGQGIVAGINAGRFVKGEDAIIIDRSQGYIGVLVDDLVTKGTNEPYRMMTSRAEYRLFLRYDNADKRLTPIGYEAGLISEERYEAFKRKYEAVDAEHERLSKIYVGPTPELEKILSEAGSTLPPSGISLAELIRRPDVTYDMLAPIDPSRPELSTDIRKEVETDIKYEGYLKLEEDKIRKFTKLEKKAIPSDTDYSKITGLRLEARQKLDKMKPESVGQASRISGVSPADISVLLVYLESLKGGSDV
jgi:tRNA uridine 5-carboxymethylaminomethyl modification enzyme